MLLGLLMSGNIQGAIISFVISVPLIILILSTHEYAHGLVANKLGDPTAENRGRLTLNPLKHIDPLGFLMFLLIGIGYAKPVPICDRYFKKPKRDMALVAAAGPLANLLLALIFTLLVKILFLIAPFLSLDGWQMEAAQYAYIIFDYGMYYSLAFMIFNLIPVPPLDGSRILYAFLPQKALLWVQKYEQYFLWGLFGLFLVCSILNISIISVVVKFLMNILYKIFFIS